MDAGGPRRKKRYRRHDQLDLWKSTAGDAGLDREAVNRTYKSYGVYTLRLRRSDAGLPEGSPLAREPKGWPVRELLGWPALARQPHPVSLSACSKNEKKTKIPFFSLAFPFYCVTLLFIVDYCRLRIFR